MEIFISRLKPLENFWYIFKVVVGEANIDDPLLQFSSVVDRIYQLSHISLQLFLSDLCPLIVLKQDIVLLLQTINLLLQLSPDPSILLMLKILLYLRSIHKFVFLRVHESSCFQHCLLYIFNFNIISGRKMFYFVLQLQNYPI